MALILFKIFENNRFNRVYLLIVTLKSSPYSQSEQEPPESSTSEPTCQFLVRPVGDDEIEAIAQIITESFHSSSGFWGWTFPILRLGIYEDLKHRLLSTKPNQACLVAINTIESPYLPVGTVELGLRFSDGWTQVGRSFPYLSNLAVHPQFRRRGVASQLLQGCERLVQEWGFKDIYLHVLEQNEQARQLYFQQGYRVKKVEKKCLFWPWSHPRQIFLHKHLDPNS